MVRGKKNWGEKEIFIVPGEKKYNFGNRWGGKNINYFDYIHPCKSIELSSTGTLDNSDL